MKGEGGNFLVPCSWFLVVGSWLLEPMGRTNFSGRRRVQRRSQCGGSIGREAQRAEPEAGISEGRNLGGSEGGGRKFLGSGGPEVEGRGSRAEAGSRNFGGRSFGGAEGGGSGTFKMRSLGGRRSGLGSWFLVLGFLFLVPCSWFLVL